MISRRKFLLSATALTVAPIALVQQAPGVLTMEQLDALLTSLSEFPKPDYLMVNPTTFERLRSIYRAAL